ncbi:putative DB module [Trichinella spiralis]|nr:putative DB module [Trichinella spiralis]
MLTSIYIIVFISIMLIAYGQAEVILCQYLPCEYCEDPRLSTHCIAHCKQCIAESRVWFDNPLVHTVPQMSKEEASRIFRRCCENMDIPDGCYDLCSYDTTYTQVFEIRIVFFVPLIIYIIYVLKQAHKRRCCKFHHLREILICASGGNDVTHCCGEYGAFSGGLSYCRMFCRPSDNRWAVDYPLNTLYASCLKFIEGYLYCMYLNLPKP